MSKLKKTRKQKIAIDQRRQVYTLENKNILSPQSEPTKSMSLINNSYLIHDISKTAILTAAIIAMQVILFFLLKKHIIILPKINY